MLFIYRSRNTYGSTLCYKYFIYNVKKKYIIIKGDGAAICSYLFVGDLVWWLHKILIDGENGEAYNVGSNEVI